MHFSKISNTGTSICFKDQIHRLFTRVFLQCRLFKRQFKYKNHKIPVPPIFLDNYDFFSPTAMWMKTGSKERQIGQLNRVLLFYIIKPKRWLFNLTLSRPEKNNLLCFCQNFITLPGIPVIVFHGFQNSNFLHIFFGF